MVEVEGNLLYITKSGHLTTEAAFIIVNLKAPPELLFWLKEHGHCPECNEIIIKQQDHLFELGYESEEEDNPINLEDD